MTRDSTVTPASARAATRDIVLAGDRTENRVSARRHSLVVRFLKAGLPLSALAISGVFGLTVLQTMGWGTSIPALEIPQIVPENLAMQNPHYEGFNKDGGRYWVRAESAQQDLKVKALTLIKLNGITGELIDAKKLKTTLAAKRGTFDSKTNVLELYESIEVDGDAGMKARLKQATIDTKENIITSKEPVEVMMETGTITANQMTARQKAKEYTFVDDVRTHLNGRAAKDEAASAAKPGVNAMIGSSNAPVDITSNRLDINDNTKTAVFSGTVTAIQDGASMTTPELEITYEGSASPQTGSAASTASGGGKLKRMIAKSQVTLKQANGDTVSSRSADFDPITQRAVLDGDVVMMQQPDKRATADKAEIDQASNAVLLTGDVVVTQGQNVLKGRRLTFNRGTSTMQLTSPGPNGKGGRISARFQQAQGAPSQSPKPESSSPQGIAFGASFKTDPGAPVVIDANRLDVDDGAHLAVFTGDVQAVQGEFVIKAAEIAAAYAGSAGLNGQVASANSAKPGAAQLTRIRARTKVQITSKDGQKAEGDSADFDPKANMATLSGNVTLTQGKNVVRGTKLVIDMTTGETVIKNEAISDSAPPAVSTDGTATAGTSSSGSPGRPSAVFYPGELKAKAAKPAPATSGSAWKTESAPVSRP